VRKTPSKIVINISRLCEVSFLVSLYLETMSYLQLSTDAYEVLSTFCKNSGETKVESAAPKKRRFGLGKKEEWR
jgi:hypothetical protein